MKPIELTDGIIKIRPECWNCERVKYCPFAKVGFTCPGGF